MVIKTIDGEKLAELYNSGYSLNKLAEHFGVNRKTIDRKLGQFGIKKTAQVDQSGVLPANPENMRKYCKPPDGCLKCPFDDCRASYGKRGKNKRTAKEFEWLKNAINKT